MSKRPGGELATRPLHFIWIADCSLSMAHDGKIQALNTAIREAIPHMQQVAEENPNAEVLVRAVRFSSGATWHLALPTPVAEFTWTEVSAEGVTDLGKALSLVAAELAIPPMTERALPPVLVLVSDGYPTDEYTRGLQALLELPWGRKAVRIAIAIGEDAAQPEAQEVFQRFIGHPELKPLQANRPEALVRQIKWASTAVLQAVSAPASRPTQRLAPGITVPLPLPPADSNGSPTDDVW